MSSTMSPSLAATRCALRVQGAVARRLADDRGDIPAWVMITVMTAGIVVVLWGVAKTALDTMLTNALASVK
ncbi:hypothetical protein [Motilibacter rhizosphaerae]|uniref:hypothetical protein n=1 Tax=Motilibacter rhizosphaerae TaxID=598652 RepID=UPI0013EEB747|nr:hypothetical protein [Motilibacter rhizosphaerae]